MTKGCRIDKHMGVQAVAFSPSNLWGRTLESKTGVKLKYHGNRAKSVFRQGLESLHRMRNSPGSLEARLANFLDHLVRLPLTRKTVV